MFRLPRTISLIIVLCLAFIFFLNKGLTPTPLPQTSPTPAVKSLTTIAQNPALLLDGTVVKVADGDTLTVMKDAKKQTIRIIGIDTPETVDPRKPVQCFGKAASDRAKELLMGQQVTLVPDPTQGDTDKYGRFLRYVFINGTDDYGLGAILEGYAHEYTYNLPYKYQADYKKAEIAARNAKVGLWAAGACK